MRYGVMTDRRWRAVWASWIGYFAVAEYAALKSRNPKAPLSYFMRTTLGVRHHPLHHRAGQCAFAASVIWLATHLYERVTDD